MRRKFGSPRPCRSTRTIRASDGFVLALQGIRRAACRLVRSDERNVGGEPPHLGHQFRSVLRLVPGTLRDPARLLGGFWAYVDARDAADACRLAVEADIGGHRVYNIAAATSHNPTPTEELVRKFFSGDADPGRHDGMLGRARRRPRPRRARLRDRAPLADCLRPDGTPIAAE